jgi:hypothetical protein
MYKDNVLNSLLERYFDDILGKSSEKFSRKEWELLLNELEQRSEILTDLLKGADGPYFLKGTSNFQIGTKATIANLLSKGEIIGYLVNTPEHKVARILTLSQEAQLSRKILDQRVRDGLYISAKPIEDISEIPKFFE